MVLQPPSFQPCPALIAGIGPLECVRPAGHPGAHQFHSRSVGQLKDTEANGDDCERR